MKRRMVLSLFGGILIATSIAGATLGTAQAQKQPDMREALEALRTAKRALDDAGGGKGGHRVAAIKLVEQAIEQVKSGIEYDKSH